MQIVLVKEKLKMYFEMKSKVIKFCGDCLLFVLHGLVISLGIVVIAAMVFAIYQQFVGA